MTSKVNLAASLTWISILALTPSTTSACFSREMKVEIFTYSYIQRYCQPRITLWTWDWDAKTGRPSQGSGGWDELPQQARGTVHIYEPCVFYTSSFIPSYPHKYFSLNKPTCAKLCLVYNHFAGRTWGMANFPSPRFLQEKVPYRLIYLHVLGAYEGFYCQKNRNLSAHNALR